jgi:signal transduction histidine kinase
MAVIVEDHGIGIPLEDQARIFEPFFRGSNTGEHEGTGLGLPVVKALVESMGGRLEVWSQPSQGSRFTILLPRQPRPSGLSKGLA